MRNQRAGIPVLTGTAWGWCYGAHRGSGRRGRARGNVAFDPRVPYVASLAYLVVFGSVVAFGAYLTLLKAVGPGPASYRRRRDSGGRDGRIHGVRGYRWTPIARSASFSRSPATGSRSNRRDGNAAVSTTIRRSDVPLYRSPRAPAFGASSRSRSMERSANRVAVVAALRDTRQASVAGAGEIRVECYSDGNECEVTQDLAKRFEAQNDDVKIAIEQGAVQGDPRAAARAARGRRRARHARVTDLGGLSKYYSTSRPTSRTRSTGKPISARTLPWMRPSPGERAFTAC